MWDWDDFDVLRSRAVAPLFSRAPHPLGVEPRQYQYAAAEYALQRDACILGDEPGVGKTGEAILIDNALREGERHPSRTLAIVPASLRIKWARDVWRWSTTPDATVYLVEKSKDGVSDKHDWVVMSYALLANDNILDALLDLHWDHVILDEAHAIKAPGGATKRAEAIVAPELLPSVTGRFDLLSGSIMPNSPREVYNAARLLDWNSIDRMSLEVFNEHYYGLGEGWVFTPEWDEGLQGYVRRRHRSSEVRNQPRNLEELQWRLRKHLMIRRLKEQVLPELPPKQWCPVPLGLTPGIRRAMKHPGWREAEALYAMDPHAFDSGVPVDGHIAEARAELGLAKAPAVADFVAELLAEGVEKIVVGAWHLPVLAYLRKEFEQYGCAYMDGSTPGRRRQEAVDRFQADDDTRVILGQIIPLGEGWDLFAAHHVVLAEPWWVPGKNDQFVDRVHRSGQEHDVVAYLPIVPDTLDERVLATAIEKDRSIHLATDYDYGS